MEHFAGILESLQQGRLPTDDHMIKIYPNSFEINESTNLVMAKDGNGKWLLATGEGKLFNQLEGIKIGSGKVCPLTHMNRLVLNRHFPYTVPQAFGTTIATLGLGDRLGLASPGHIQTVKGHEVKPILAQQSIRELNLTNRSMTEVLDAAAFAVFQEGYKGGYGADGDHLKEVKDIEESLALGISFLTLDCSDQIDNTVETASHVEVKNQFDALPLATKDNYTNYYLNHSFHVNGLTITYDELSLQKNVLLYGKAIDFTEHVSKSYIEKMDKAIDFELSIDETKTVTSPDAHFFVAEELKRRNVPLTSLAPRFCGEFQKGIDYIGDINQFEKELNDHASIAKYFGYKLSIHSGSDKFSVFPIIGKYTEGLFHLKTAGTNWLEAMRVIAAINPKLYRRMHTYAIEHFNEVLSYYHITPDLDSIKPLDQSPDDELPTYMDHDAARQLIHVTYGVLLTATDSKGNPLFRDEFFQTLNNEEKAYTDELIKHIGKHIRLLGL